MTQDEVQALDQLFQVAITCVEVDPDDDGRVNQTLGKDLEQEVPVRFHAVTEKVHHPAHTVRRKGRRK